MNVRDAKNEKEVTMVSARNELLSELEEMCRKGVELYVDGKAVLPGEAVARTVQEDSPYMADFVLDAAGDVEQIWFDKVTCE